MDEGSLRVHHKVCQGIGTFTSTAQPRLLSSDPLENPRNSTRKYHATINYHDRDEDLAEYD